MLNVRRADHVRSCRNGLFMRNSPCPRIDPHAVKELGFQVLVIGKFHHDVERVHQASSSGSRSLTTDLSDSR